jgi:hypothetical protein
MTLETGGPHCSINLFGTKGQESRGLCLVGDSQSVDKSTRTRGQSICDGRHADN